MGKIEYRGTLVCSMFFDPDGNPLTLAEPNQPAQAA
jgi:hypothetical protein